MGIGKWFIAAYRMPFRVEKLEQDVDKLKGPHGVVWKDTCRQCKNGLIRLIDHLSHQGIDLPPVSEVVPDMDLGDEK